MSAAAPEPLPARILALLNTRGPLKARELADSLQCDRTAVNKALYGPLTGRVQQDKAYRWTVISSGTGATKSESAADQAGPLTQLARYYLDCLAHDAEQGCSVFGSNNHGDLDYSEINELPELHEGGTWSDTVGEAAHALIQRARLDKGTALYLGYPVLLRYHRTARWEGYFVEPILLYTLERGENGVLQVADEVPTLNFKALRSLGIGGNVLDDVIALSDELNLYSNEEPPALEDIALRLKDVRPDWPWIDEPVLGERKTAPALSSVSIAGIYNYAVVVNADRSNFTQGLEAELRQLSRTPSELLEKTALGHWIAGHDQIAPTNDEKPLIEVIKLNTEQRAAVRSALQQPLTVITGPPGTGKSQVVTALLANCAWQGQKVLFASKNNKAVDVVEQRINGLASRPTLIRLGSRQYEARLAEFLMGLLSATTAPEDQSEYDHAKETQEKLSAELAKLTAAERTLIDARNIVDTLEASVEDWRTIFGESLSDLETVDVTGLQATLQPLRRTLLRADRRQAGPFQRLVWFALRAKRLEELNEAAGQCEISSALGLLNLQLPDAPEDDNGVQAFGALDQSIQDRTLALSAIQKYLRALKDLSQQQPLESLARQQALLDERLAENAGGLWRAWARLQPARLSRQERQSLGQYRALLEVVLDCNRTNKPIPGNSWHQYRNLVPKIAHLIPCWAVTSLSANGKVPFEPAFFDLLIIDEASQCDIASVLPLLYRAKRVAVIGDPKQLTHITKLSPREDALLQQKSGLPAEMGHWSYSANSLYTLASTLATGESFVALRDHHRSHADIIEFSNRRFYEGRLRVATRYDQLRLIESGKPAVRWLSVTGEVRRPVSGGSVNESEAQAVVKLLEQMVLRREYSGTVGVVTPFRAQSNRIRDLVNANPTLADRLARSEFISETAHQFQGDERDLMIFSPVVSRGVTPGSLGFLRKNGNLFNVAITRARAALYVVGDKGAARESGVDYLADFAKYADEIENQAAVRDALTQNVELGPDYPVVAKPELVSDWERLFYKALFEAGIRAIPQYAVEKYLLDFAIIVGDRRLNLEVDGERYHRAWDGELTRRDRLRNQRMMELGWDVKRFWVYQIRDKLPWCLEEVKKWVASGS